MDAVFTAAVPPIYHITTDPIVRSVGRSEPVYFGLRGCHRLSDCTDLIIPSTPSTIKAPVRTPCLATSFNAATAASFNPPIDSNFSQTALTLTTQDTAYENPCRRGPRARQNSVG